MGPRTIAILIVAAAVGAVVVAGAHNGQPRSAPPARLQAESIPARAVIGPQANARALPAKSTVALSERKAATPISSPSSAVDASNGCSFVSAAGGEIRVYADTEIGDEGDLLATYRLQEGQRTGEIAPAGSSGMVRVRYRSTRRDPWQEAGKQMCSGGATVQLP